MDKIKNGLKCKIEKTPRGGFPALREHINGDNRSLIVLNSKGKRKRGNNKKGLIPIEVGDHCVVCILHYNQDFINIYKILEIDSVNSCMYVDKVNKYEEEIPSYLMEAVEEAKKLATGEV